WSGTIEHLRKLIIGVLAVEGSLLVACPAPPAPSPSPSAPTAGWTSPSESASAPDSASPSGSPSTEGPEGSRFALMLVDASAAGSVQLLNAAIERADELGVEIASFDAEGDEDRLPDLVASAIEGGFDAVLVEPLHWNGLEGVAKKSK